MHKRELARELARRMHLGGDNYAEETANLILDHLFAEDGIIARELAAGRDVTITGFGTFGTRSYSERVIQNPHGGEPLDVPSGRRATFHPGAALRRAVQPEVRLWPVHR